MGIFDKIKRVFGAKKTEKKKSIHEKQEIDLKSNTISKLDFNQEVIEESKPVLKKDELSEPETDSVLDSETDSVLESEIDSVSEPETDSALESEIDSVPASVSEKEYKESFFSRSSQNKKEKLDQTLDKTRKGFFDKMKSFFSSKSKIDDQFLDRLEEMLIVADVGVETTVKIIDLVEKYVAENKYVDQEELKSILKHQIVHLLNIEEKSVDGMISSSNPYVLLFVGVNGVGKTTTIAKLANSLKNEGKKVLLGAADTFRAAAIDQLDTWAQRIDVPIIKQEMGADPASVAYDTIQSALASKVDFVLIDTAGRLHNKINLMLELEKITKTINKLLPNAPHEVVLVLDASTGQNALEQAKQFLKSTKVTHLALSKLDGTAKGGVVISICDQLSIPIKYIGVGEKINDIQLFNSKYFVESLFK